MASFRRIPSPAYPDRLYPNGASSTFSSPSSPSTKLVINGKHSSSSSLFSVQAFTLNFRRLLTSRKTWRKSLYRCLVFFIAGILLGLTPFGHVTDVEKHDVFFEMKPPHVNVQLESENVDNVSRHNEVVFDFSSYGIDQRNEFEASDGYRFDFAPRKQLIVITPTYNRAMQAYFLNRLAQVLSLVPPPVLWIVVEENAASYETAELLRKTGVMYRHLVSQKNSTDVKDRGVHQRNVGLEHIERHRLDGIVYFADDDNVYSAELFDRLREIRYIFLAN